MKHVIFPVWVIAYLTGDFDETVLGMAETPKEISDIQNEYESVFGINIMFRTQTLTVGEYLQERQNAFKGLFASLNGPMTKVITCLKR